MKNISILDHPSKIRDLTDIDLITEVALHSPNPAHRMVAVEKIDDQDILDQIIQFDNYYVVKKTALAKLTEEKLIQKYILGEDLRIRSLATKKIRSQEKIEFILLNETDSNTRKNILKNYWKNDKDLLFILALKDDNDKIRRESITRIEDLNHLLKLALSETEPSNFELILSKLNFQVQKEYRNLLKKI